MPARYAARSRCHAQAPIPDQTRPRQSKPNVQILRHIALEIDPFAWRRAAHTAAGGDAWPSARRSQCGVQTS